MRLIDADRLLRAINELSEEDMPVFEDGSEEFNNIKNAIKVIVKYQPTLKFKAVRVDGKIKIRCMWDD